MAALGELHLALRKRERLARVLLQSGLVVKEIDLRRTSGLEEVYDSLGLRRQARKAGNSRWVGGSACTGCRRCAQDAPDGLIEIRNGLAVIDRSRIDLENPAAIERCPTDAIVWIEGQQFPRLHIAGESPAEFAEAHA